MKFLIFLLIISGCATVSPQDYGKSLKMFQEIWLSKNPSKIESTFGKAQKVIENSDYTEIVYQKEDTSYFHIYINKSHDKILSARLWLLDQKTANIDFIKSPA